MHLMTRFFLFGAALLAVAAAQQPARKPDVAFIRTPPEVVDEMLRLAEVAREDVVYDLGSGDGRIVITAAQRFGASGVGIDIDPKLVALARANARAAGVDHRVSFQEQDLFEADFHEATVVMLYLLPELNLRLRPRLLTELKPGTRVVSHDFDMGDWGADETTTVTVTQREHKIHYWQVPADVGGEWTWSAGEGAKRRAYRLRLQQTFQRVSGALAGDGAEVPLFHPELRGTRLTFSLPPRGQAPPATFSGEAQGGEIYFRAEGGAQGPQRFTATRRP